MRYILRRNPHRAEEIAASREDKYQTLSRAAVEYNPYLSAHPRARVEVALRLFENRRQKLRLAQWVKLSIEGRAIRVAKELQALGEIAQLDGCYVLKTDLSREAASKDTVHERYKDLALVEWAFRESKTVHLEMRPIYVRRKSRTRGHAFVVMLAYTLIKELAIRWQPLDLTVKEGIDQSLPCV